MLGTLDHQGTEVRSPRRPLRGTAREVVADCLLAGDSAATAAARAGVSLGFVYAVRRGLAEAGRLPEVNLRIKSPVWSEEDCRRLLDLVRAGLSQAEIADRLGRTRAAVDIRLRRLAVQAGQFRPARPASIQGRWQPEEDRLLREAAAEGGFEAARAALPHRSADAVRTRLGMLGLSTGTRRKEATSLPRSRRRQGWTPAEVRLLASLCRDAGSWEAVGLRLGRTRHSVKSLAWRFGIRLGEGLVRRNPGTPDLVWANSLPLTATEARAFLMRRDYSVTAVRDGVWLVDGRRRLDDDALLSLAQARAFLLMSTGSNAGVVPARSFKTDAEP